MTHASTTGRRAARAVFLAVAVGVLAVAGTLTAPAARAGTVNGTPVTTENEFCDPSTSASVDLSVISPGPQPRVGQDFHLVLTVVGRNQCVTTQTASMNIQLPAGITLSPTGQTACVMFASSNPGGTTLHVPCAGSNADNGYLRVDPQNAGTWTLARTGRNVAQVQLAVRANASGVRTAFGRVCDSGSSVICEGSPVADAIPFVQFTVVPAATPPSSVTATQLTVRKVGTICSSNPCPDLATTPTSIRVQAVMTGTRPAGTWQIQRRGPGSGSFTTIATRTVTAGSGGPQSMVTTVATGLTPSTVHRFRACFTPTGSTQVCGAQIQLATKPA